MPYIYFSCAHPEPLSCGVQLKYGIVSVNPEWNSLDSLVPDESYVGDVFLAGIIYPYA